MDPQDTLSEDYKRMLPEDFEKFPEEVKKHLLEQVEMRLQRANSHNTETLRKLHKQTSDLRYAIQDAIGECRDDERTMAWYELWVVSQAVHAALTQLSNIIYMAGIRIKIVEEETELSHESNPR